MIRLPEWRMRNYARRLVGLKTREEVKAILDEVAIELLEELSREYF